MESWLFLWPWAFQPLLGIHMAATVVSGALGWAKEKRIVGKDTWS